MNEFLNRTFEKFESQITDNIFCFIQNDKELMKAYLDIVAENQNLQYINSHIAQEVAKRYGLENMGTSAKSPKSSLIQTFSELRRIS